MRQICEDIKLYIQEIGPNDELGKHHQILKEYSSKIFNHIKDLDEFGQQHMDQQPIKAERNLSMSDSNFPASNRSPYPVPNMHPHKPSQPPPQNPTSYPSNDFQGMDYNPPPQNPSNPNSNTKHFMVPSQNQNNGSIGNQPGMNQVGSISPLSQENVSYFKLSIFFD